MSDEARLWAKVLAPVPWDGSCLCKHSVADHEDGWCARQCDGPCTKKGCDCPGYSAGKSISQSASCAAVLKDLAENAWADGTNAFPGVETLVITTRLSESSVKTALRRLKGTRIIVPGDTRIRDAHIVRADRRPNSWTLDMSLVRDDLPVDRLRRLGVSFPPIRAFIEQVIAERGLLEKKDGGQPLTPVKPDSGRGSAAAPRDGETPGTGVSHQTDGGQPPGARGSAADPEPPPEPNPGTTTAADSPGSPADPAGEDLSVGGGEDQVDELDDELIAEAETLLAGLPAPWSLGVRQQRTMVGAVAEALRTWYPRDLVARLTCNPQGIKSYAATLRWRLGDLPAPPNSRPDRAELARRKAELAEAAAQEEELALARAAAMAECDLCDIRGRVVVRDEDGYEIDCPHDASRVEVQRQLAAERWAARMSRRQGALL